MCVCPSVCLCPSIRDAAGVSDVLLISAFDNLTAEDLHLLMNRSPVVDGEVLKKITTFMDESCECHMTQGAICQK